MGSPSSPASSSPSNQRGRRDRRPVPARCTPADGRPPLTQVGAALRAHPTATLRLGWRWRGAEGRRGWHFTDATLESARRAVGVQVQSAVTIGLHGRGRHRRGGGVANPSAPFVNATELTRAVRHGLLEAAEHGSAVVATRPPRCEGIRPRARRASSFSAAPVRSPPRAPRRRAPRRSNTAPPTPRSQVRVPRGCRS